MREAIRDYVEREEKRESFKQDALRAWEAYQENGLHLMLEEADDMVPAFREWLIEKRPDINKKEVSRLSD
ncbi:hypothetical protein TCT1_01070 [Xenorhabdus sp. TCT-1]|uniref:CopG family transcriptional regulator n=2 Tax=Xenorhabdus taiwanensis TaxID=3085177 RepID=A0ABN7BZR6_9GAMM|nr:hypothetical protein TCT1_01070 [Xenorhabdus sp. TCT-1]